MNLYTFQHKVSEQIAILFYDGYATYEDLLKIYPELEGYRIQQQILMELLPYEVPSGKLLNVGIDTNTEDHVKALNQEIDKLEQKKSLLLRDINILQNQENAAAKPVLEDVIGKMEYSSGGDIILGGKSPTTH